METGGQGGSGMGIEIDPAVFAHESGSACANESLIVLGAAGPEPAARALERACERFALVAEDGREYADEDAADESGLYTPNYYSEVRHSPRGPWIYLDCKGEIPGPMRAGLLAVLVEELERAGLHGVRVAVPENTDRA